MVIYYKDFLLNVFFIFFPLVFYPYTLRARSKILLNRFLLLSLFSVALVSAMSFPLNLYGLSYDFRAIPLTIGFLYAGPQVSILLYLVVIIYRYVMGNPNNFLYCISIIPTYFMIILFLRKYNSLKLHYKIINSIVICTLIKLVTFTIYLSLTHTINLLFKSPVVTLQIYLLQGLIVGLYVLLLEFINNYFHMQQEIIKSEKIKIVSDIAASVAHEIRNPLTSVRGFIQLLENNELNKEKRDLYQKISLAELDRALLIISDYLSLAKPDPENIDQVNIYDEVIYVSNVLLTYATYNNVEIDIDVQENVRVRIKGDKHKLRQALINIGKNAIEAMPNGGILEFKINEVNNTAVLIISDTGIGMTTHQIDRLGTPYYSTKEKGTGLGTMVSFGIIKKMDGRIQIKSELGKGTEYSIIFPIT